jgi:hypothetical protein
MRSMDSGVIPQHWPRRPSGVDCHLCEGQIRHHRATSDQQQELLRTTFDEVAELYDRARPDYPPQIFDDLKDGSRGLALDEAIALAQVLNVSFSELLPGPVFRNVP